MSRDDDDYNPQATEVLGGSSSTEVLHSSRAVPLDAGKGMPPAPAADEVRTSDLHVDRHAEKPKQTVPTTSAKVRELEDEAAGFEDPHATVAAAESYATRGESSYLRPLTAHVKVHEDSLDPLRPRTEQRVLADDAPDPRDRPPMARAPTQAPRPSTPVAVPPPQPQAPPPPAPPAAAVAPAYAQPVAYAQPYAEEPDDEDPASLERVRVVSKRRRPRQVKTGRARTGVVLVLVLLGMLTLIGSAARKMLFAEQSADDELTVEATPAAWAPDAEPSDLVETPAAWAPEPEDPVERDGAAAEDGRAADGEEAGAAKKPSASRSKRNSDRRAARSKLRVALLGVTDKSGGPKSATKLVKAELSAALKKADVVIGNKRSPFGASVVIERVRKKRSAESLLAEVKCRVVVRTLPGNEIKMSSTATAAASMAGALDATDERELVETAVAACASKIGKDVARFAREHG